VITALIKHQFVYAGCQHNVYHVNTNEGLPKHQHEWPHVTACHAGSLIVRKEGLELVLTKDSTPVTLVANEWHELEAGEDGTVFENIFKEGLY
jgi:quercetin dioxygenase-like cupin family protein